MSDPTEKELRAPDAVAAAVAPTNEERHDPPDDGEFGGAVGEKDVDSIEAASRDEEEQEEKHNDLIKTKSYATDTSGVTGVTDTPDAAELYAQRPWYKS